MLPRTLSNFMNAFTASDHTYYPFATTNAQDFKNLMSVYMDATLRPLLKETDFAQEGWRIGPQNPQALAAGQEATAEDSKLVFKGVVYNEMKGQMSDASYLYHIRFQDQIFPAINNSGGDPQKITDLTYQQLKDFHAEHYHPSNAKLFTYGDMPLADHLRELDARLKSFERIQGDVDVRLPLDLTHSPKNITLDGPVDPLVDANRQFKTSVSWVLGDTTNVVESFSLSLISALLMDGYGSPLYKGLIESGLGIDWSPNTGYDGSGRLGIFSVGLTGVQQDDVGTVKSKIHEILQEMRQKGFERSKIDGYLHQLELGLKHKTANFGLGVLHRLKGKWFSGVDPFDTLAWNETISAFEEALAQGGYLEGLMDKYLLNDHTLTFTMAPSASFAQDLAKEEETRLAAKLEEISDEAGGTQKAQSQLERAEADLLLEQGKSSTEALGCLPTVHVSDIPRSKDPLALKSLTHDSVPNVPVQWYDAPTNGLLYFRAIQTLKNLPAELRELVPLFSDAIMRLGTKTKTTEQLEDLIKLKTGGISLGYHSASSATDFKSATEGFIFGGMALDRNVPVMFDLLREIALETDFEQPQAVQQIRQLLQASADGVVNDIASSGHSYARRAAEAGLTADAFLREQVSGLSQVKLVTSLAARPETDQLVDVIEKLKEIQQLILSPGTGDLRAALTCHGESQPENLKNLGKFLSTRRAAGTSLLQQKPVSFSRNIKTFFPLPYQVYYGALALGTTSYTAPESAPLQLLAQLLTHKHLHQEIREKGGAYGGGAYFRPLDGIFGFYSYRDPNPVNTMKIMANAGRWAVESKTWTKSDLEEAKISVFQGVDAPRSVNQEGMGQFLYGVTDEMRQERRERLLDVTEAQIRDVAQNFVVEPLGRDEGRMTFLGAKQDWVDSSWAVKEMNVNSGAAQ
jgi:presequence protease